MAASGTRKRKRVDADDDYSAGIEGEISKFMTGSAKKNTMDSDEEEEDAEDLNKKKHGVLTKVTEDSEGKKFVGNI